MVKTPPVEGIKETSPRDVENVERSSCANYDSRVLVKWRIEKVYDNDFWVDEKSRSRSSIQSTTVTEQSFCRIRIALNRVIYGVGKMMGHCLAQFHIHKLHVTSICIVCNTLL